MKIMKHVFVAGSIVLESLDRSACNDSDSCLKRETCPTVAVRIIFLRPKQGHKRSQGIRWLRVVDRLRTLLLRSWPYIVLISFVEL